VRSSSLAISVCGLSKTVLTCADGVEHNPWITALREFTEETRSALKHDHEKVCFTYDEHLLKAVLTGAISYTIDLLNVYHTVHFITRMGSTTFWRRAVGFAQQQRSMTSLQRAIMWKTIHMSWYGYPLAS
jgi:hypothetical protein